MVRSFKNRPLSMFASTWRANDATLDDNSSMIVKAAENMTNLSTASLTPNSLSAHVIANLHSYPQLNTLHIYGFQPQEHIWKLAPVSLNNLKWEIHQDWAMVGPEGNAWDFAQFVVNIVEATCPNLKSLEISIAAMRPHPPMSPVVLAERSEQYRQADRSPSIKVPNLQHFGFKLGYCSTELIDIEAPFLNFVERHAQSLKSISIPVNYHFPVKEQLDFILKVCEMLPNLQNLNLISYDESRDGQLMSGYDFFNVLTAALASPKFSIERFSTTNIGAPFSPAIGKLFGSWTSLKCLRVGDADNPTNSPFHNDGRPDFRAYRPVSIYHFPALKETTDSNSQALLGFIKNLPSSLEELYIEINGHCLRCDEDTDFDPVCNFGTPIFDALRRLHTCDIHAWTSDWGGGVSQIPEKGVFYRRLTHMAGDNVPANKIKDVWTSRMGGIHRDEKRNVTTECVEVELDDDEGVFQGKDAEEVWCDGFEIDQFQQHTTTQGGSQRCRPPYRHNHSWPFWEDKVGSYPMFRDISCFYQMGIDRLIGEK